MIVYAIDSSEFKCNFIKNIAKINNLYNVKIINLGLSDKENIYKHAKIWNEKIQVVSIGIE